MLTWRKCLVSSSLTLWLRCKHHSMGKDKLLFKRSFRRSEINPSWSFQTITPTHFMWERYLSISRQSLTKMTSWILLKANSTERTSSMSTSRYWRRSTLSDRVSSTIRERRWGTQLTFTTRVQELKFLKSFCISAPASVVSWIVNQISRTAWINFRISSNMIRLSYPSSLMRKTISVVWLCLSK